MYKGRVLRRARIGFTLLETLISVAIVAVALLAVGAVFISLLSAGTKNSDAETATLVAQGTLSHTIYDLVTGTGYTPAQKAAAFTAPVATLLVPPGTSNVTLNNQVYSYNITTQGVPIPGPVKANNALALITIQVWWNSDASGVRQGQGRTSTSMSRLINEQASQ